VVGVGLAALAVPAAFNLAWWSPLMVSGVAASCVGLYAATSRSAIAGWARFAVATVLFADTVGASLVRADITALTLIASSIVLAAVAGTAATAYRRYIEASHLVMIAAPRWPPPWPPCPPRPPA